MSSSKWSGFSDAELQALSLWDMPDVSGAEPKTKPKPKEEKPRSPVLTVNEIEVMQKQAFDEAFAKGQEEGIQKGYEEGLAKGYEEGLEKGYTENKSLLEQQMQGLREMMDTLSEPLKSMDATVEQELVGLAISIARQLIRRELKQDPGQVIAVIREAVNVIPLATQKITLTLHPEDADLVRSVFALDEETSAWKLSEDPLITRGGCKVDTEISHVDATVERRVAAVIAQVLGDERHQDDVR